jgi:hypothetical protein
VSEPDPIAAYLEALRAELRPGRARRRLVAEVEAHLLEGVREREADGMPTDAAASDAVEAFGSPSEIAQALDQDVPAWRPTSRVLAASGMAIVGVVVVVCVVVVGGPERGRVAAGEQPTRVGGTKPEAARVSSALGLSEDAPAVLAEAQAHGQDATACLIEHGAAPTAAGGLEDPGGLAALACAAVLDANELYLGSPAFAGTGAGAERTVDAALACDTEISRRPDHLGPDVGTVRTRAASCWGQDGLPEVSA